VVNSTTWPLYPQGKSPWYPLDRRFGGPQSQSGEEKDSQPLPGLIPPIIQPIAKCCTTELSWLLLVSCIYLNCIPAAVCFLRNSYSICSAQLYGL